MSKILFYINGINLGGAARVIVNLANQFSNIDYQVILVTSFCEDEEYILDKKVKRFSLENKDLHQSFIIKNFIRTYRLRKICKNEKPDILVSFMAEANFRAIAAKLFLNIKTLISIRNDPNMEYQSKLYKLTAKLLYPLASGYVFQTEEAQKWFSERIQRKSIIILNHVDRKFYDVNFNGKRKNIVTVGRLVPQKNHKLLIESFAAIANDFPDENLIIYGDGLEKQKLYELTKSLGVSDRVKFMGLKLNIQEEIKDAKLFVLSSNYEGMPNVVMEAMALGLPVIATNCPCGGPRILIDNNRTGILVKVGDTEEMADAMKHILSDSSFADYLSHNAEIAAKEFEPDKVFVRWQNYIEQII